MKITKFVHSCLLVETELPVKRVALFDPGEYSTVRPEDLVRLDDIFITHEHQDHMDISRIKRLIAIFPEVHITAPAHAITLLQDAGIQADITVPQGVKLFASPHEPIRPLSMVDPPEEIGIHYLGSLTHPGDSHSFHETMPILALPVSAPWGMTVRAVQVALDLKPKYVIPIHDWHWRDEARLQMYDRFESRLGEAGITFLKLVDGAPADISSGIS